MMLPIWRALIGASCLSFLGATIDRLLGLGLGRSQARWPRWALLGLVCLFTAALSPTSSLILFAALYLLGRIGARSLHDSSSTSGETHRRERTGGAPHRWVYGVLFVSLALCFLRPQVPFYWDEFVWLAKSRIESTGWAHLRDATLDPTADVIPNGYPILWPAAASWLSLRSQDVGALLAGAATSTMLALWLFLDGIARHSRLAGGGARWPLLLSLGLVALCPLALVHLRSAYVDLPVGFLAAALNLALIDAVRADPDDPHMHRELTTLGGVCAVAVTGLKDEGFAHVAAIVFAVAIVAVRARRWPLPRLWPAAFALLAAAVPFLSWRILLVRHHVTDADHRLGVPSFEDVPRLVKAVAIHALDLQSWGLFWPAAFGVVLSVLLRPMRFRPESRMAVLAFCAQGLALFGAVIAGPERVRDFAWSGTLINRLLMQLMPASCVAILLSCEDAALGASITPLPRATNGWPEANRSSRPE